MARLRLTPVFVALFATALALGGCATTTPADRTTTAPTDAATAAAGPNLGPDGFGALKLGMTRAEASATGLTENLAVEEGSGCGSDTDGWLKGAPTPAEEDASGRLYFSSSSGKLVAIYVYSSVATPEGITIGSSIDEVLAAYPDWQGEAEGVGIGYAAVPSNDQANYRINIDSESVIELSLESVDQDCY
jgi:hypothetical protein